MKPEQPPAPEPVRVRDLDGGLWSLAPGSFLYTQIKRDKEAGYTEQYLHVAQLRRHAVGDGVDSGPSDTELTYMAMAVVESGRAWRQGMLLALRERVKLRG